MTEIVTRAVRGSDTKLHWQFLRFLIVGAVNTAFGYAVFAAAVLLGLAPFLALLVTYAIGVVFNYFTTAHFVFGRSNLASFPSFVLAYVIIYAFNAIAYETVGRLTVGPLLTQAICLPVVAVFSFFLFKFRVFKDATGERK